MSSLQLKLKPLVECILEVRWQLEVPSPGLTRDPQYRLVLGRLFDRLVGEYPYHEELPTARIPDELSGHNVQHRLRSGPTEWPLVQIGPGIFTVNDTEKYSWEDFRARISRAVCKLFESFPQGAVPRIEDLVLRYVNAIETDYESESILGWLNQKMKIDITLPCELFEGTQVRQAPSSLQWTSMFRCERPSGMIQIGFATGQKQGRPALVWETLVRSAGEDLPELPAGFEAWIDQAHEIALDWFQKMISGELERSLSDDI